LRFIHLNARFFWGAGFRTFEERDAGGRSSSCRSTLGVLAILLIEIFEISDRDETSKSRVHESRERYSRPRVL
jgi:hypothetical protein